MDVCFISQNQNKKLWVSLINVISHSSCHRPRVHTSTFTSPVVFVCEASTVVLCCATPMLVAQKHPVESSSRCLRRSFSSSCHNWFGFYVKDTKKSTFPPPARHVAPSHGTLQAFHQYCRPALLNTIMPAVRDHPPSPLVNTRWSCVVFVM
jgi:hypothetical protein